MTEKTGLIFPVGRIRRNLKSALRGSRVTTTAAIALAAALELVTEELMVECGSMSQSKNRSRITDLHMMLAIEKDSDFEILLRDVIIAAHCRDLQAVHLHPKAK